MLAAAISQAAIGNYPAAVALGVMFVISVAINGVVKMGKRWLTRVEEEWLEQEQRLDEARKRLSGDPILSLDDEIEKRRRRGRK